MPFILLLFGAMLIVSAYRNSVMELGSALGHDIPGFAKWFAALSLVGGMGYIPGFAVPSRWLLALVLVSVFLRNYAAIINGLSAIGQQASAAPATTPTPAEQYAAVNGLAPAATAAATAVATASGFGGAQQIAGIVSLAEQLGGHAQHA